MMLLTGILCLIRVICHVRRIDPVLRMIVHVLCAGNGKNMLRKE